MHLYHTDYRHLGVSVIIHFIIISAAVILLPDENLSDRERDITVYLTKSIKDSHSDAEIMRRTESAVKDGAAQPDAAPEALAQSQAAKEAEPADEAGRESLSGIANTDDEKVYFSAEQYVKARAREKIKISYPVSAARKNIEGSVTVEILVDETGKISNAQVISSSGYRILDKAAMEAVMRANFIPAQLYGKKVSDTLKILIEYKLTQDLL